MPTKIIVTGCGTGVGKTIVSAILTEALEADYWKPIECGSAEESDTAIIRSLISSRKSVVHPPAYSLKAPLSPHHAARLEQMQIESKRIVPPETERPLIIETAGGILVPLTYEMLALDLLDKWDCLWVVVSKHYLGSINHTLLTIEALKQRQVDILSIVFNGDSHPDTEEAILAFSQLPCLGRISHESNISPHTIQKYAELWKTELKLSRFAKYLMAIENY